MSVEPDLKVTWFVRFCPDTHTHPHAHTHTHAGPIAPPRPQKWTVNIRQSWGKFSAATSDGGWGSRCGVSWSVGVVCNVLACLLTYLLTFIRWYSCAGYWPMGYVVCDVWQAMDVMLCTSSIWHMCTISIDRYIGIRYPLKAAAAARFSRVTIQEQK